MLVTGKVKLKTRYGQDTEMTFTVYNHTVMLWDSPAKSWVPLNRIRHKGNRQRVIKAVMQQLAEAERFAVTAPAQPEGPPEGPKGPAAA